MANRREKRAREIQEAIGQVLMRHWDPIGVSDVPEAKGEYDSYIGPIYRVLAGSRSKKELMSYLAHVETNIIGCAGLAREPIRAVVTRLLALDVTL